jgi:thioredoxin 2
MKSTITICQACTAINRVPFAAPSGKAPVCGKCKADLNIHNGVTELDAKSLPLLVAKNPQAMVVDFWAPWCGPCKMFAPTFQDAARELHDRISFTKLNTEAQPEAGSAYQIRSIPTLVLFHHGKEVARQSGALPLSELIQWLKKVQ